MDLKYSGKIMQNDPNQETQETRYHAENAAANSLQKTLSSLFFHRLTSFSIKLFAGYNSSARSNIFLA